MEALPHSVDVEDGKFAFMGRDGMIWTGSIEGRRLCIPYRTF